MRREGFDLQLTQYDERGWRATFYTSGMEPSPTSATGTGWEPSPWHATQRAAWEALRKAERGWTGAGQEARGEAAFTDNTRTGQPSGCPHREPADISRPATAAWA